MTDSLDAYDAQLEQAAEAAARAGRDPSIRDLSTRELVELETLRPALAAWTHYLSAGYTYALDQAVLYRAPLGSRTRGELPFGAVGPAFLHPQMALARAREDYPGKIDRRATVALMVDALLWMGAQSAVTVLGRDEVERRSPHRGVTGWYRCSAEIMARLKYGNPTPSLAGLPGRSSASVAPEGSTLRTWERRAAMRTDVDSTRGMLTDYLRTMEPTALLTVARSADRPLCTRKPGRPTREVHRSSGCVLDSCLVAVDVLSRYTAREGGRILVPPMTPGTVLAALESARVAFPGLIEPVRAFSAPDSGGQIHQRRAWFRVSRERLGLAPVEDAVLRNELARWVAAQVRQRAADYVASRSVR